MSMTDLTGRINIYDCPTCGGLTITIHAVHGVTPMLLKCEVLAEGCSGWAESRMYLDIPDDAVPEWEWYKPEGAEFKALSVEMQNHVVLGGLDLRPIAERE